MEEGLVGFMCGFLVGVFFVLLPHSASNQTAKYSKYMVENNKTCLSFDDIKVILGDKK